jgi:hypothetical protein
MLQSSLFYVIINIVYAVPQKFEALEIIVVLQLKTVSWGVVHVVEHLPSKYRAHSLNPSTKIKVKSNDIKNFA